MNILPEMTPKGLRDPILEIRSTLMQAWLAKVVYDVAEDMKRQCIKTLNANCACDCDPVQLFAALKPLYHEEVPIVGS